MYSPSRGHATHLVAIASSMGGLHALTSILGYLTRSFPAAIVIAQHLAPQRTYLVELLTPKTTLQVKLAEPGDRLENGAVFIAPPDHHLVVGPDAVLSLSSAPKVNFSRPSAEPLFQSAARCFQQRLIGVVLTGADGDGSSGGIQTIKQRGGLVIAQDEASSANFSMPHSAIRTGCVDLVLSLPEIAPKILQILRNEDRASQDKLNRNTEHRASQGQSAA